MNRIIAAATTLAAALGLALAGAQPAQAAARVTATSSLGSAVAKPDGSTTFQIKGSGFQSIKGGFGGIYLMFGWVDDPSGGSWKPSNGGKTGSDLLYVPDSETKDNQGYQKFIAFPGSSTESSANGGEVSASGNFSVSLVVPGPEFTAQDRDGNSRSVDCLAVQCGIITIGAHGVVNAKNETFTPISFGDASGASGTSSTSGSTGSSGSDGSSSTSGSTGTATTPAATAAASAAEAEGDADGEAADVPATVGLSQSAIQAGRVIGFTGQGFEAGEQVVATVGAGLAGVGPLTAGRFGEVAGAISLPSDMRAGTHVITLTGAGSGKVAEAEVSVMADPSAAAATTETQPVSDWWRYAAIAVAALAGVLLILIVTSLVTAIVRRRKASRAGKVRRVKAPRGGDGL
ncbi:hypothetical protein [Tessaracoccus palaemonis]|uniref:Uncharacterized protein n=1 Tax=Tessaracoccus palaemonis TaxID=2829499 RepID=A0ABX8SFY5_9ACTN|nr:hypothetical protein [Tessaracoccus palaemonis]QXT62271.1 hypothetical protein KDB89_10965 [Tessaracoccus palaemonis]